MFSQYLVVATALGILLALLIAYRRYSLRVEHQDQLAEERHAADVFDAHARGEVDRDGNPLCEICKDLATRSVPTLERIWLDRIRVVAWFNRLYSMPPRYTVETDEKGPKRLCEVHGRQASEKLHHFNAQLRAEYAEFNAQQAFKVTAMARGGLAKLLHETEAVHASVYGSANMELSRVLHNMPGQTVALPPARVVAEVSVARLEASSEHEA